MIFISSPYSDLQKSVIKKRVDMITYYAGYLLNQGIVSISPIIVGEQIMKHFNFPSDFNFWDKVCFSYLEKSSEMHVLTLYGWRGSKGVNGEIEYAEKNGIPIKYIDVIDHENGVYDFVENEKMKQRQRLINKIKVAKDGKG